MTNAAEIESQAATWLIRQDAGGLSPAQRDALDLWLAADGRHLAAYKRLEMAWQIADRLHVFGPDVGRQAQSQGFRSTERRGTRPAWVRTGVLACAVAASLILGLMYLLPSSQSQWQTYTTGFGGFERVVLADGSTVELNTGSQLRVRLSADRRDIDLIQGEANFKVAHDKTRPFEVHAGVTTIRAVGTAFSVQRLDQQQVNVVVSEGRIIIEPADVSDPNPEKTVASRSLGAGEIAMIEKGRTQIQHVEPSVIARRLAWTNGRLLFDGQPLAEVIGEFNAYNRCQLVIEDAAIAQLRVGGSFAATDLESFIAALEHTLHVRILDSAASRIRTGCASDGAITLVGADKLNKNDHR